eukprot:4612804-Prymnesium_polylepis.1
MRNISSDVAASRARSSCHALRRIPSWLQPNISAMVSPAEPRAEGKPRAPMPVATAPSGSLTALSAISLAP